MTVGRVLCLATIMIAALLAVTSCAPEERSTVPSAELPIVAGAYPQPIFVQVDRLRRALDYLGAPLSDKTKQQLREAREEEDQPKAVRMIQAALDPYCLVGININPESRVKVIPGPARPELVQGDWRQFLVKVHNEAGVTSPLRHHSPQAVPLVAADRTDDHWLEMMVFENRPMRRDLSGIDLEYRIIQLFSSQQGKRSAVLSFDVGQGTQDIGFRNDILLTFDILPTSKVTIRLKDELGNPTTSAFEIRDANRRTYPSQARREAPDFIFILRLTEMTVKS